MKIHKKKLNWRSSLTPFKEVKKIVIHHTAGNSDETLDSIHNYHRNSRGWLGIGYNYLIIKNGEIWEGRGENQGAHARGHNHNTMGICLPGNFHTGTNKPTKEQMKGAAELIAHLIEKHNLKISDVIEHKTIGSTACPGKNFDLKELHSLIEKELAPKSPIYRVFVDNKQIFALREKENIIRQLDEHIGTAKEIRLERIDK